jgi:hypothetical protein
MIYENYLISLYGLSRNPTSVPNITLALHNHPRPCAGHKSCSHRNAYVKICIHPLPFLCVITLATASCNREVEVSRQTVSDYVRSQFAPYLSVKNITLEKVAVGDVERFNFKATVSPQEALFDSVSFAEIKSDLISRGLKPNESRPGLYQPSDFEFGGLDRIQFLRPVHSPSDFLIFYGSVAARKVVDKIECGGLSIASGTENTGKPKGAFSPEALVVGSDDYQKNLEKVVNQQKERLAQEQAVAAAEQAARDKRKSDLLDATKPGVHYRGTWSEESRSRIVELAFTDQQMEGRILKAKFTLPDDPRQTLEYEGVLDTEPSQGGKGPVKMHLVRGNGRTADWGGAYSYNNLSYQNAEIDLDYVQGSLIRHDENIFNLQIDLKKVTSIADQR